MISVGTDLRHSYAFHARVTTGRKKKMYSSEYLDSLQTLEPFNTIEQFWINLHRHREDIKKVGT